MMKQDTFPAAPVLGMEAMDASHRALFDAMKQALQADDRDFARCYTALVANLERDFAKEEEWMEETDFPGLLTHREQHARVLGALHHAASKVRGGDTAIGREAISLLPQWLLVHIPTMDAVLAGAMQLSDAPVENTRRASAAP